MSSPKLGCSPLRSFPSGGAVFEALGRAFQSYWLTLYSRRSATLWMPLWYLRSDGFWHPLVREGAKPLASDPGSMKRLHDHYAGARIDLELHRRLLDPAERERLQAMLLGTYFDDATREQLALQIEWNRAADRYSRQLLGLGVAGRLKSEADAEALLVREAEPVRSQGFRIAVLEAYEHRCAACGLRLRTPDGLSAVQGAHIKPWSEFHDDRVSNGLGLCATCHWCFDNYLWTVEISSTIKVSRVLHWEHNRPAHLESLERRQLLVPSEPMLQPDPECLSWHRDRWSASA